MAESGLFDDVETAARECVLYVIASPEFTGCKFLTRLGVTRDEAQECLARWPHLNDGDHSTADHVLVNNCFNEICHGIWVPPEEWDTWFTRSRAAIRAAYVQWLLAVGCTEGGIA